IALTLKKRLERAGYTVEVEKDGVRVLDRCLEENWGLVLLDLQLPRMDGFMILEALQKEERLQKLPVVIISASSSEEDIERTRELGARNYLIKPIESDELLENVEIYLEANNDE
ncbi:MAG: response regulator, partial [bacterium]